MTRQIVTTPEAETHIRTIDRWWRLNRQAAPDLFVEELAACFDLLAANPHLGHAYRATRQPGIRRILLRATRYHAYYRVENDTVFVLAVWHTQRGTGPDLRSLFS